MRSDGLVPGDEYQLDILYSVGDGMRCGYGSGLTRSTQPCMMLTC
jgi:hypothetical protein